MIKLMGSAPDSNNEPTDEKIEFEIHEDLIEMICDGKYYFQREEDGFLSEIIIDGKLYVDLRKVKKKTTSIDPSIYP